MSAAWFEGEPRDSAGIVGRSQPRRGFGVSAPGFNLGLVFARYPLHPLPAAGNSQRVFRDDLYVVAAFAFVPAIAELAHAFDDR